MVAVQRRTSDPLPRYFRRVPGAANIPTEHEFERLVGRDLHIVEEIKAKTHSRYRCCLTKRE